MAASRLSTLLAALCCAPAAALAGGAPLVSYRFDGVYQGRATLSDGLSDFSCEDLPIAGIEIRDGALRAYYGGRQIVKGLVFETGYVDADFYFPDGQSSALEGMIDRDGLLTAGVIKDGCHWIVELNKVFGPPNAPQS